LYCGKKRQKVLLLKDWNALATSSESIFDTSFPEKEYKTDIKKFSPVRLAKGLV
jgi:hypothetical protein